METSSDFVSFKKVLVFGSEGAGKTSLTKKLENKFILQIIFFKIY